MSGVDIVACTACDLPLVRAAYEMGRATQRAQHSVVWPEFTDAAILAEMDAGALFRVCNAGATVGVFTMLHADPLIWGADERGAHLYLHRIARASSAPRLPLLDTVLAWTREQCHRLGRDGIRMDTWAEAHALITYYAARGFRHVGDRQLSADPRLPPHYHGLVLALLESPLTDTARR